MENGQIVGSKDRHARTHAGVWALEDVRNEEGRRKQIPVPYGASGKRGAARSAINATARAWSQS